jgi:hypothetical protein
MRHRGSRATSVLFAAAVMIAASAAHAQQFRPLTIEGGQGLPGLTVGFDGFRTSSGGFYNRFGIATINTTPADPLIWTESTINHIAYDSYFTLSGNGPSRLGIADDVGDTLSPQIRASYGYTDTLNASIPLSFASPGTHIGDSTSLTGQPPHAVNTPADRARGGWGGLEFQGGGGWLRSGINPINGRDGVFIAQLTVNRGSTLSGTVLFANLLSQGVFVNIPLTLNGPEVIGEATPGVFRPFVLRSYLVATNENLSHSRSGRNAGTGVGNSQRFGAADVYHLWIEIVPAPGAAAAFGLAGLVAIRRRRACP